MYARKILYKENDANLIIACLLIMWIKNYEKNKIK